MKPWMTAGLAAVLWTAGCDVHTVNQNISQGRTTTLSNVLLSYTVVNEKGDTESVFGEFASQVVIHQHSIVIHRVDGAGRVIAVDDNFRGIRWEPAPEELIEQSNQ